MTRTTRRQEATRIADMTAIKAKYEAERDALIALYEAGSTDVTVEAINFLHDAIDDLGREMRPVMGASMGDWDDKTSRWHY